MDWRSLRWIDRYNVKEKKFYHYPKIETNTVFRIKKWTENEVFFITEKGLMLYDSKTDSILNQDKALEKISKDLSFTKDISSFSYKPITALMVDNQRNLWVGTKSALYLVEQTKAFKNLQLINTADNKPLGGDVSSIVTDKEGNVWVGYFDAVIDVFDKTGSTRIKRYTCYSETNKINNYPGIGSIQALHEAKDGKIWIGSFIGGLYQYDPSTTLFTYIPLDQRDVNHLGKHDVRGISSDSHGNIWVALHGGGLSCYNPNTKEITRYRADYANWQTSLQENWLISV
ncbi:MAG: SMP-30/gluconolactonase/LRE family protein, partial [Bacteroidales bacterium]|nr:SMP-30/gluconolactonase/LRE family protein [Bacteroidales bacterium]